MKTLLRTSILFAGLFAMSIPASADWWYTDKNQFVVDMHHRHGHGCGHTFVDGVWRVAKPIVIEDDNGGVAVYIRTAKGWQRFAYSVPAKRHGHPEQP